MYATRSMYLRTMYEMSPSIGVCRICLAVDVAMCEIAGTPLQLVFESLSNNFLHSADRRPVEACYMCCARLKKTHKLMVAVARAEHVLTQILARSAEVTKTSVSSVDRLAMGLCPSLVLCQPECVDILPPTCVVEAVPSPHTINPLPLSEMVLKVEEIKTEANIHDEEIEIELGELVDPREDDSGKWEPDGDTALRDRGETDGQTNTGGGEAEKRISAEESSTNTKRKLGPESRFECDVCHRFFTEKRLHAHLQTHTTDNPHQCHICLRYFTNLPRHIEKHEKQKNVYFHCHICSCKFNKKASLRSHLRVHTGEKPFECNYCKRRFAQKNTLRNHIRTHTGEKPYKCHVCDRQFTNSCNLIEHCSTHTDEKLFKCKVCRKEFKLRSSYRYHLKTHTGEKPYECDVCQSRFRISSHLTRHLSTHSTEKPYQCDICQRGFVIKSRLNDHIKMHMGVRERFTCTVCKRQFNYKETLKLHLRIHTGEKPYGCDMCNRRFSQNKYLKSHYKSHAGEKPY